MKRFRLTKVSKILIMILVVAALCGAGFFLIKSGFVKSGDKTIFYFKGNKQVEIDFSYYIIDNQVTRSLMLDYEVKKRRESLKK